MVCEWCELLYWSTFAIYDISLERQLLLTTYCRFLQFQILR